MDASSFDSDHKRYQIQVNRSDTGQVCGVTIIIVKWCKLARCYTALHQTACIIDHTVLPLEGQKAPGDFGVSLDLFSPPLNDVIEQLVSCIPREKSIELTGAISRWKWNEQDKKNQRRRLRYGCVLLGFSFSIKQSSSSWWVLTCIRGAHREKLVLWQPCCKNICGNSDKVSPSNFASTILFFQ